MVLLSEKDKTYPLSYERNKEIDFIKCFGKYVRPSKHVASQTHVYPYKHLINVSKPLPLFSSALHPRELTSVKHETPAHFPTGFWETQPMGGTGERLQVGRGEKTGYSPLREILINGLLPPSLQLCLGPPPDLV